MQLFRNGSCASTTGRPRAFFGQVRIDWRFQPPEPGRAGTALLTFEPGARTAWHRHPLGQTLIITSGTGWTQCHREPKIEVQAGDVIWCPPGHRHWHGATATTAMTHIAITEMLDGIAVEWMEHVSDAEYLAAVSPAP